VIQKQEVQHKLFRAVSQKQKYKCSGKVPSAIFLIWVDKAGWFYVAAHYWWCRATPKSWSASDILPMWTIWS